MLPIIILCLMIVSKSVAAPVVESPKTCIERAELALKMVEIPERIERLVHQLRDLNPLLQNFSLVKFADSDRAEMGLVGKGLVRPDELDAIVHECVSFVAKAYPVGESGAQICDLGQYTDDYSQYEAFLEEVAKHPDYDRKIGTAKICIQL